MKFLEELEELRLRIPRLYNINIGSENSDYCTHADKMKNSYLVFACYESEDCYYGGIELHSRDCVDAEYCDRSELCYECTDVDQSYDCNFCQDIKNCSNCTLCYDCIGCKNCFGCAGLRQKKYCFFNEQLSKEEYGKRVKEFAPKNKEAFLSAQKRFEELRLKIPRRSAYLVQSENCTGDHIIQSKNCAACFDVHGSEDCLYCSDTWQTKDSADIIFSADTALCYECFSIGTNAYNCNFSNYTRTCSDCEYCELCFSCKDCFGCVGLKNRQYYILNKPYTRDEYFKKVAEIKAEMHADGSYGKHLPTTYKLEDTAVMYWQ